MNETFPAPWRVEKIGDNFVVYSANNNAVAEVGVLQEELAKSIAAHPDLLKTLKAVYPLIGGGLIQIGSKLMGGKTAIEAAIAKAEGRDA